MADPDKFDYHLEIGADYYRLALTQAGQPSGSAYGPVANAPALAARLLTIASINSLEFLGALANPAAEWIERAPGTPEAVALQALLPVIPPPSE